MRLLLTLAFFCSSHFPAVYGQSLADTKDYIIEHVDANDPIPSYDNAIFFTNVTKVDAERIAGKSLSQDELDNLFIYMRDCYLDNNRTKWGWTVGQTIDIRDISKVSTIRSAGQNNYYKITVYIKGNYYSKEYEKMSTTGINYKQLDKMQILISDNSDAAQKIKKAIIQLGKLKGVIITDGDVF